MVTLRAIRSSRVYWCMCVAVELVLTFALITLVILGRVMPHSDSDVENPEGKASGRNGRQAGPDKGESSGNEFSQEKLLDALTKKNLEMFDMFTMSLTQTLDKRYSDTFKKKSNSKKRTATATVTSAEAGSEEPDKEPLGGNRFSEDESHDYGVDDRELESSYGVDSERLFDKDPLGLERDDEADHENQDMLMTYPDESDSFLGDDLGLPKELKRAQARRLLYGPMAQSQKEQSEIKVQKETEDSMLLRFLKSLPETDKPHPKPVGSNDFEQIFGQAPSFTVEKKQPCFALDAQQVTMVKRFWQCPRPQKMGAFSEESHKILKVQDDFLQHIQVPPLDDFVKMVNQRAGPTTKEGYRAKLWQNLEYDVRRIHKGARVGFLTDALSQKIMFRLGELLKSRQSEGTLDAAKFNEAHQLLLGAFDVSEAYPTTELAACGGRVTDPKAVSPCWRFGASDTS